MYLARIGSHYSIPHVDVSETIKQLLFLNKI